MKAKKQNPFLWPMLQTLPYFRALLRAVEADFYKEFELTSPILDLGCGDGQFASQVFEQQIDVGIDPALNSLREAKRQTPSPTPALEKGKGVNPLMTYKDLIQSYGARLPFPDGYFASGFSNSVLEHIPELQPVLNETGRVMRKGALFLFCVPNHRWQENLSISGSLRRFGLNGLANAYVRLFTRISRHANMLSPEEWKRRLSEAGFEMERFWHYFPPAALHALEWGHYFGLPSWIVRALTGRWVLAPAKWNLGLTERAVRKLAEGGKDGHGTYTWYVARKRLAN